MTTSTPRGEYSARLNRVVNYINDHLDEPMALQELADIAAFSPYHFHRIFKAVVGETLGSFIWRLRLERAANLLLRQPTTRITVIALDCGFSSHSNFSRAFKGRFGVSASEFRATSTRNRCNLERNKGEDDRSGPTYPRTCWFYENPHTGGGQAMQPVEVKVLPTYHVAYVRRLGYSKGVFQEHLSAAFQKVCRWAADQNLMGPDSVIIGVPYDNPDITPNARCRYDACVTVPASVTRGSAEIDIQDLPGGKYAVQRIDVEDPAEIGRIVDSMYGNWLPDSGFLADNRPPLEVYYDSEERGPKTRIILDYCIPITPL